MNWEHDQRKGTRQSRGYDAQWDRLSRAAIKRQPWCSDCGQMHLATNPLTGDHLRWPAFTIDDVDVVCRRCNSRRGARRRAATAVASFEQGSARTPDPAEVFERIRTDPVGFA